METCSDSDWYSGQPIQCWKETFLGIAFSGAPSKEGLPWHQQETGARQLPNTLSLLWIFRLGTTISTIDPLFLAKGNETGLFWPR